MPASFCEVPTGGDIFIAREVRGSTIAVKKVREGWCGVYGELGAGRRDLKAPWCRNVAVFCQNRALRALWDVSVLSCRTGGRVGAECVAVSVVISVSAKSWAVPGTGGGDGGSVVAVGVVRTPSAVQCCDGGGGGSGAGRGGEGEMSAAALVTRRVEVMGVGGRTLTARCVAERENSGLQFLRR